MNLKFLHMLAFIMIAKKFLIGGLKRDSGRRLGSVQVDVTNLRRHRSDTRTVGKEREKENFTSIGSAIK